MIGLTLIHMRGAILPPFAPSKSAAAHGPQREPCPWPPTNAAPGTVPGSTGRPCGLAYPTNPPAAGACAAVVRCVCVCDFPPGQVTPGPGRGHSEQSGGGPPGTSREASTPRPPGPGKRPPFRGREINPAAPKIWNPRPLKHASTLCRGRATPARLGARFLDRQHIQSADGPMARAPSAPKPANDGLALRTTSPRLLKNNKSFPRPQWRANSTVTQRCAQDVGRQVALPGGPEF